MIAIKDFWKCDRIHQVMWHSHRVNVTKVIRRGLVKYFPEPYLNYVKYEMDINAFMYVPLQCATMADIDMIVKNDTEMSIPMRLLRSNEWSAYYFDVTFYRYCCSDLFIDYNECANYCSIKNISNYNPRYIEAIVAAMQTIMIITRRYYDS